MNTSFLEGLIEDLAGMIAENICHFQEVIDKYQQHSLNSTSINQEQQSLFHYYLEQQTPILQKEVPLLSQSQILSKAISTFKQLSKVEKLSYLRQYLKETKYNHDNQANQFDHGHLQMEPLLDYNFTYPLSSADMIDNGINEEDPLHLDQMYSYQMNLENHGFAEKGHKEWGGLQGLFTSKKGESGREREENRRGEGNAKQRQREKVHGKNEDRSQFQTLKSLFKKLQNSS